MHGVSTWLFWPVLQPDAQEQFLRIKNAYQTLVDKKSRSRYNSSRRSSANWDPFQWDPSPGSRQKTKQEEEFYGFGTNACLLLVITFCVCKSNLEDSLHDDRHALNVVNCSLCVALVGG